MTHIGILGGSFSPPHIGHLWIAQQAIEDNNLDEVWLMPNSGLGHYGKAPTASAEDRLSMCYAMTNKDLPADVTIHTADFEISNKMEYTCQLVEFLNNPYYSDNQFYLIIGGDWDITKFKDWERITSAFELIIIHRPGDMDCGTNEKQKIAFDISSSILRDRISKGKTIRGLVTPSVELYIKDHNLYV